MPEEEENDKKWLQSTPKVLQKFTNDTNFDQDKKNFESQPNVNVSKSLDDEDQMALQSYVSISIHPPLGWRPQMFFVSFLFL
jgi:hypothetical protein